jgi:hypothetical protein
VDSKSGAVNLKFGAWIEFLEQKLTKMRNGGLFYGHLAAGFHQVN